jgi:TIR domain
MQAGKLDPVGFWSYSRQDDEHSGGRLSQLRARLSSELQINYGRDRVQIFQDSAAIPYGADWDGVIRDALNRSTFFIPILTPNFIQSEFCLHEVEIFLEREKALHAAHPDLAGYRRIFPILYIPIQGREAREPALVRELEQVQWLPFEKLRHLDYDEPGLRQTVSEFAATICELLDRRTEHPVVRQPPKVAVAQRLVAEPPPVPVPEPDAPLVAEPVPEPAAEPDRAERMAHGLAVGGIATILATLVWLLTLPDKMEDRLWFATLILPSALAALVGSFLARRLFDHGWPGGGRKRLLLHGLLATGLATPLWFAMVSIAATLQDRLGGNGGLGWFVLVFALAGAAGACFLILPANLLAIIGLGRLPGRERQIGLGGLAVAAAAVFTFGVLVKSEAQQQKDFLALMARKGELSGLNDDSSGPSRESVLATQKRLGLPETGMRDDATVEALEQMPDKREWQVAPGDDLAGVLDRAYWSGVHGGSRDQTILVAPGTYRLVPKDNSSGLYLQGTRITLRGTGRIEDTVLVLPADKGLTIDDDTIENLTIRQENGGSGSAIVTTGPNLDPEKGENPQATLRNIVVDGRSTGDAVVIAGNRYESVLVDRVTIRNADGTGIRISGMRFDPSGSYDGKTMLAPRAVVRNSTLSGKFSALVVDGEAAPLVEDNRIGPMREGNGIFVSGEAAGTYRRNRITDAGIYSAISATGGARPLFEANMVGKAGECVHAGEKAVLTLRANELTACFGGRADGEAEIRLRSNPGLLASDITVSGKARVTTE